MTTETPTLFSTDLAAKIVAMENFRDFLKYVKIYEPPQAARPGSGGTIPFEMWEHLDELIDWLQYPWDAYARGDTVEAKDRQGVMGKCRRRGFSWLIAAYGAWLLLKDMSAVSLFFSSQQGPSIDLLDKAAFVYKNLLPHWQKPILRGKDSVGGGEFAIEGNSRILAFPSTPTAGISYSGTFVFMDEAEHHEFIAQAISAVKPITDTGGQLLIGSTVDKTKAVSVWRSYIVNHKKLGFTEFFIPYGTRDFETDEYYQEIRNGIEEDTLAELGLTRDQFMEQNWPRSREEMLRSSRALAYFSPDAIEYMQENAQKPITRTEKDDLPEDFHEIMNIWVRRTPRGSYVSGSDVSHGLSGAFDYSVTAILDMDSWRVVADVFTNRHEPEDFAEASMDLLEFYRSPMWGIERNEWGILVVRAAQDRPYKGTLFHRERAGTKGGSRSKDRDPGWLTDTRTRPRMWGQLKQVIDSQELTVPSREGGIQFGAVIRDMESDGNPKARGGDHDDYPTAVAIAYQMKDYAISYANVSSDYKKPRTA